MKIWNPTALARDANLVVAAGIHGQQRGQSLDKGTSQPWGILALTAGGQVLGRGPDCLTRGGRPPSSARAGLGWEEADVPTETCQAALSAVFIQSPPETPGSGPQMAYF